MDVIGAALLLSAAVQKIVERIREGASWLTGTWVTLVAWALGIVAAVATDLALVEDVLQSNVADWFDYGLTGIAIGSGAGFLADLTGRSSSTVVVVENGGH